ncbi:MAG: methionyl-tRNA formyltransferase [Bacteroidetes bacterium]|nr:methionyl-tRNA formyltransferase [Bacteroidota bacterium]
MGTPEFAVASLEAMLEAGLHVVAVVTAPDKPAGRGMQVRESAVKTYATSKGLPVLQPSKLKDPAFIEQLQQYKPDLQVVVAFRMLPEIVWNMPPMGTLNVHGSLLPQYRGAAPINWAIINGEHETGVTTFLLQHEIDTGNILLQEKIALTENTTAGELHDEMKKTGAQLLIKTLKALTEENLQEIPQEELTAGKKLCHAPKIHSEDCKINFQQSVEAVHNLVRGLSPFPGAYTILQEKNFKIYRTEKETIQPKESVGQWITDGKSFLKFACKDGYVICKEVQMEGKKKMDIATFLRGYRFN